MRLISIYSITIIGCLSLLTAKAYSEEEGDTDDRPAWSIGAGIGFGAYYYPTYGGIGTPGPASEGSQGLGAAGGLGGYVGDNWYSSPNAHVMVEWQFADSLALLFQGGVSYSDNDSSGGNYEYYNVGVSILAGLRWILNPGGAVEVSTYGAFSGSWSFGFSDIESDFEPPENLESWVVKNRSISYSLGFHIGLALERKLLDNLYLRLESSLVRVAYGYGENKQTFSDEERSTSNSKSFSTGLAFSPAIQLRLAF